MNFEFIELFYLKGHKSWKSLTGLQPFIKIYISEGKYNTLQEEHPD